MPISSLTSLLIKGERDKLKDKFSSGVEQASGFFSQLADIQKSQAPAREATGPRRSLVEAAVEEEAGPAEGTLGPTELKPKPEGEPLLEFGQESIDELRVSGAFRPTDRNDLEALATTVGRNLRNNLEEEITDDDALLERLFNTSSFQVGGQETDSMFPVLPKALSEIEFKELKGESITDFEKQVLNMARDRFADESVVSILDATPVGPGKAKKVKNLADKADKKIEQAIELAQEVPSFVKEGVDLLARKRARVDDILFDMQEVKNLNLNLNAIGLADNRVARDIAETLPKADRVKIETLNKKIKNKTINRDDIIAIGDDILNNPTGVEFSDEFTALAGDYYKTTIDRTNALRAKALADPKNTALQSQLNQEIAKSYELSQAYQKIRSARGRSLSFLKRMPQNQEERIVRATSKILEKLPKEEAIKVHDELIQNAGNPDAVRTILTKYGQTTMRGFVQDVIINNLLSNPATHLRNLVGTGLNNTLRLARVPIEVGLDGAISMATRTPRTRTLGELPAALEGATIGTKEVLGDLATAAKTPKASLKKLFTEEFAPLRSDEFGNLPGIAGDSNLAKAGSALRTPTKLLTLEDRAMRQIFKNQEEMRIAARKKAGIDTSKFEAKIGDEVEEILFQKELGPLAKGVQAVLNQNPTIKTIFQPFFKTPINIIKEGFAHTPVGGAYEVALASYKNTRDRERFTKQFAKSMLGTAILAPFFAWALEENDDGLPNITSTPPINAAERETFFRNQQPQSIRIGDKYYSYKDMEPLAPLLAIASEGAAEFKKTGRWDDALYKASLEFLPQMADKSFLKTWGDLYNAVFFQSDVDPTGRAYNFLKGKTNMVIPNFISSVARGTDPAIRRSENIWEQLQLNIPGASQNVSPRADVFGDVALREGGLGQSLFGIVKTKKIDITPLEKELGRLKVDIAPNPRKLKNITLSPRDQYIWSQIRGPLLEENLVSLMANPEYKKASDAQREKAVKQIISNTKEVADVVFSLTQKEALQKSLLENDADLKKALIKMSEADPRFRNMSSGQREAMVERNFTELKQNMINSFQNANE